MPCAHRRTMATSRGGRTWWAHVDFTRINIELTILKKEIEDLLNMALSMSVVDSGPRFRAIAGFLKGRDSTSTA